MTVALPSLRTPADILAVIPYLLGFPPTDSLVLAGVRGKRLVFEVRADLPSPDEVPIVADELVDLLCRQRVSGALLVGYGPAKRVTPIVRAVRKTLRRHPITVLEALRAADGRYWSYLCRDRACCPPEGTPYDVTTSAVAASATLAGLCPASSRDELVARYASVRGAGRRAMQDASRRADARLSELLGVAAGDGHRGAGAATVLRDAGRAAVDEAIEATTPLGDDDVAWLALLLINPVIRDYAWSRVGQRIERHLELWGDVVRRVEPELAAAPGTLLAFAAWRHGEGAVACIALDRALNADPNYTLAHLLGETIARGVGPGEWLDVVDDVDVSRR
jgi:hypothetical protein